MDKQLLLFGLMLKAGRITVGDEPVTDAIRRGEVDVLCVAQDAAENTLRRFARYAEEEGLPFLRLPYDKSTFGGVFGRRDVAVAGVTDVGFAAKLLELAAAEDASLTDAAARYRKKADAIVEEQKKKRRAQKKPAWQKNVSASAEEPEKEPEEKKPAAPAKDIREPNARSFENREAPGKVYGKAPHSKSMSIGERRREDAVRKAEKQETSGEKRPYGGKPAYGGRKPYGGKPAYGERKPYGDKPAYGEKRPYGGKPAYGGKKPYGSKPAYGERKPYGDKPAYGEKKPYGDKPAYGEKKPYGDKPAYGERKTYGGKPAYGEKRPYGANPNNNGSYKPRDNRTNVKNAPRSAGPAPSYRKDTAAKRPYNPSVKRGNGGKA